MSLIFHCKTIIRNKNQQFHHDEAFKRIVSDNDFLKANQGLMKIDHLIIIMPYQILTQLNGIKGNMSEKQGYKLKRLAENFKIYVA